jgi:2-methylcitrate dehydratase PrpD
VRQLAAIELRVPPQVLAFHHGAPGEHADARRSLTHVAALALADGALGPEQFEPRRLAAARLAEMRSHIAPVADPALAPDAAHAVIRLTDGRTAAHGVRCARGTRARPLTDAELSDKFRDLACTTLASGQAERLLALAWNIRALHDVGALVRASIPEETFEPAQLPGSPLIPR